MLHLAQQLLCFWLHHILRPVLQQASFLLELPPFSASKALRCSQSSSSLILMTLVLTSTPRSITLKKRGRIHGRHQKGMIYLCIFWLRNDVKQENSRENWHQPSCLLCLGSWSLQFECARRVCVLRSLLWLGLTFYHVPMTPQHGYIYVGLGMKNLDLPFMLWDGHPILPWSCFVWKVLLFSPV